MERYPKRKLYNNAPNTDGSGALTPPGGADGAVQYNNGGVFGGFGTWDDTLSKLILSGDLTLDIYKQFGIRESAAAPNRKVEIVNWGGSIVAQSGNIDKNVFMSDTITDAVVTILLFAQGVKSDGSMGISKLITASFRKDGTADPVQIGANTDLASKEDSPDTPTITISLGLAGTDNIRIAYDTNNLADIYTFNFWALLAFTKV